MSPSVQRVETDTGLYKINRISYESPATLHGHRERNIMVDLILMFLVASHFLTMLFIHMFPLNWTNFSTLKNIPRNRPAP